MKKTIYISMCLLSLAGIIFTAAALTSAFLSGKITGWGGSTFALVSGSVIITFLLGNYAAGRLTKKIAGSINNINFFGNNENIYEELSPFVKALTRQKEDFNQHIVALEYRKNTLNTITENTREGIVILDKKGIILSANKSAVKLFDTSFREYIGKNILTFARDMKLLDGIKKALTGKSVEITLDHSGKTLQVFLSPSFALDNINGVILLFMDVTEKANAEKIRREFSANVSHELKTPLTTILGLSEMLENKMVKPDDIDNFIVKIKTETAELIKLVEDIIKISELDEKKAENNLEEFNLSALTLEIGDSLRQIAQAKGVDLEINGGDFKITANRTMIYELLFNLIENAVKYTEQGSVTVNLTRQNDKTQIEVLDTGIGIPQEHIGRIFERFYRVDKSRSKKTGGTGLGLSIVKHIVQYHKGEVELTSQENVGTCVKIVI